MRRMPEAVRRLREPWASRRAQVRGLDEELELEFRFGQRVTKTDRGYMMGGTLKGGSSSMWYPVTRAQYHAFKRWQRLEGTQEARDDEALARLSELLARHDVALATRRSGATHRRQQDDPEPWRGFGPLYGDMHQILSALPEEHLARPTLRRIQLGGWGPDAAKASAYQDGAVLMYEFACRGARRTFLGLFLHEVGHAHEVAMSEALKDALHARYQVLLAEDAFFGVEFLVDGETRKLYQRFVFNEFLAEVYMMYAACGEGLRQAIAAQPAPARGAWEAIYALFREGFAGVEYE